MCIRAGSASRIGHVSLPLDETPAEPSERPQAVGWERNKAGKLASRIADLGPMMDPTRCGKRGTVSGADRDLQARGSSCRLESQADAMADYAFVAA